MDKPLASDILDLLSMLAAPSFDKPADPEFVKSCVSAFTDYITGRIPKRQFDEACQLLQQAANATAPRLPPARDAAPGEPAKVA